VNTLQTQMIAANTRMTEIEATQTADQTAFTNQIATINETLVTQESQITALTGRVTQLELEMGGFNLSGGFFNQFP
jgi:7,8-dihydro-6-hydroxymethylpterin-pyrophosphokinase